MRIDGTNGAELHGAPEGAPTSRHPGGPPRGQDPAAGEGLPASGAEYQSYVQKAAACKEVDLEAVAEAKGLLESGQLDTPDAAQRAAERIVTLGI